MLIQACQTPLGASPRGAVPAPSHRCQKWSNRLSRRQCLRVRGLPGRAQTGPEPSAAARSPPFARPGGLARDVRDTRADLWAWPGLSAALASLALPFTGLLSSSEQLSPPLEGSGGGSSARPKGPAGASHTALLPRKTPVSGGPAPARQPALPPPRSREGSPGKEPFGEQAHGTERPPSASSRRSRARGSDTARKAPARARAHHSPPRSPGRKPFARGAREPGAARPAGGGRQPAPGDRTQRCCPVSGPLPRGRP